MPEEEEVQEEEENPADILASFRAISAEADLLAQRAQYTEAITAYTKALNLQDPDLLDKHCLVARSRCYIHIGLPDLALADANASLKIEPNFLKGLYQKAEALYARGDFEIALMFYHRGHYIRPGMFV